MTPAKGKPLATPPPPTKPKRRFRSVTTDSPKHKKQEGEQMAIGMLKLRNGSKGKGVAHFNYIMREDKYKPHADKLEKFENYGHGNMPEWAKDNPKIFWQEADKHERENGRVYKEHIIALPRELNEEQRLELVNDWIKNEVGDKHPYSFAIHTPQGMDGKEQPHVHFMFSQRTHDGIERSPDQFFKRYNSKYPERGGAKKANETLTKTQSKEKTKEQRLRLGDFINKHLERAGSRNRVDMRNYKERGVEKPQNISYTQMQDPAVKQAYKAKIEAQAEIYEAIKERIEMIGFGKSKAIIKDLEIRIAQEQASKAYSMTKPAEPPQEQPAEQKSRKGQWVRHRQKEQEQKAELVKAQLEKMGEDKGLVYDSLYKKMATVTDDKLQEFKQTHIEQAEQLEQKAQHEILTDKELMDYSISKKYVNSIEQIQQERTAPAVTTSPPAHPAEKVADMPPPQPQEQLGHGLSEKDESNIKGMREIIKATFANDPAKLKIALERLDKQAEAVARGEVKLSDKSFVTKEAPKFDYERPAEQLQDKGKDR